MFWPDGRYYKGFLFMIFQDNFTKTLDMDKDIKEKQMDQHMKEDGLKIKRMVWENKYLMVQKYMVFGKMMNIRKND